LVEGVGVLLASHNVLVSCLPFLLVLKAELQQIRNAQPQLLENPEAKQRIEQLAHADDVLQQRKAAVTQLALVLELAQDLDAAQESLDSQQSSDAAAAFLDDPEQLAQMLGVNDA